MMVRAAVSTGRRAAGLPLLAAGRRRRSFTLTELMLVTAIITVLATTALFALFGAMEQAKQTRTQAQVLKIHSLIMDRWETYRTRKLPILIPPSASPLTRADIRLHAIRDLMRMELPERISDLAITPAPYPADRSLSVRPPALWMKYRRRAGFSRVLPPVTDWPTSTAVPPNWTPSHQQSECLYLILAAIQDGDSTALDFFKDAEIADTDADGMFEIVDAWGRPIVFMRWAPGFATTPGPDGFWGTDQNDDGDGDNDPTNFEEIGWVGSDDRSELQDRNAEVSPDAFDPLRRDPRWRDAVRSNDPFMLYPLVFSAGPDGDYDIVAEDENSPIAYPFTKHPFNARQPYPNDPYLLITLNNGNKVQLGKPSINSQDNITNHLQQAE